MFPFRLHYYLKWIKFRNIINSVRLVRFFSTFCGRLLHQTAFRNVGTYPSLFTLRMEPPDLHEKGGDIMDIVYIPYSPITKKLRTKTRKFYSLYSLYTLRVGGKFWSCSLVPVFWGGGHTSEEHLGQERD